MYIPPKIGRPSKSAPKGKWRRSLKRQFPKNLYNRRWQGGSVLSRAKRCIGDTLY
jgi:hypothetical protein